MVKYMTLYDWYISRGGLTSISSLEEKKNIFSSAKSTSLMVFNSFKSFDGFIRFMHKWLKMTKA